jgi:uncharacterized SAM-binding protein YcdF (DUF218 family)
VLYLISKAFWLVAQPGNLLVLLLVVGTALLFTRHDRLGRGLVLLVSLLMLATAVLPVGDWLLAPLEDRFPPLTHLPEHVDGVIMLGGAVDTRLTAARGQPLVNEHAERFIAFADLARRYPQAKLVFAGGGPALQGGKFREADAALQVLQWMGMDTHRVIFERESLNTLQNVENAKVLAEPKPNEIWILVTSAFHMPRAVGLFRGQGWEITPDPVDYQTGARPDDPALSIDPVRHLDLLSLAIKEWIGLLANRWLGYSTAYFPAPAS